MSIVLNGLSKNSYLSVAEKREVIDWYKNYFTDKLDIINEALHAEKLETQVQLELNAVAAKTLAKAS